MSGEGSKAYWLSYPDPAARKIKLRISTSQLDAANDGDVDSQNAICMRYKSAVGLPRDFRVWWHILKHNFESATQVPATTETRRETTEKKPSKVKDQYPDIGEGGCGCQCFNCDIRMVHCYDRSTGCKAIRP